MTKYERKPFSLLPPDAKDFSHYSDAAFWVCEVPRRVTLEPPPAVTAVAGPAVLRTLPHSGYFAV